MAKGEVVTDPAEIQALLSSSGLKAKGAHNPDDVIGGLFQYFKKNGGAGFIGVTRDPETHVLTLVSNTKTKGANATVAKIDLSKIPADRVFDLADPALFSQMTTRFGKTNFFTTLKSEGVVAIRGEIPSEAIVKLVGAGSHNNARNTAPAQQAIKTLLGS